MHTKFEMNRLKTLAYISITNRTDRRQTTDNRRQTRNFLLHFLTPRGPKRVEKKFERNRKKKNFQDYRNICPSELRTYKK